MTKAAIEFKDVDYTANGIHILKRITGFFPKGKITTLVGPSGAGKSSLFKLCNGLQTANSGQIYINNKLIEQYPPTVLRRTVGIALQEATMINGSVEKNLALPLTLKGEKLHKELAIELLKVVGLKESYMSRNTQELSGGQRQKLSIARTLVNKPQVLLLDEITSSLDRVSQQDIEKLILRINKKYNTTIIWITHNLQQALSLGDYTWVMIDGEVVETGESDLLTNPKNERVKQFIKGGME
ncbi:MULTISPECIES: ABC transporter ATP-binding protein [Virgibacillus]|uniref:ABC transporter ATP-binding protein n=1 Tax=Virgibacillus TaxID=84406 RepID=UPI0004D0E986|nr:MULTISPECIES: phosphate ABC transporter ATP-binding protein [Virgibacillus]AIF42424.1 amino acid ABC transporter ATP-binding protein [Virgibacillus sp. SK37]